MDIKKVKIFQKSVSPLDARSKNQTGAHSRESSNMENHLEAQRRNITPLMNVSPLMNFKPLGAN